jgi:hypothetical protein
MKNLILSLITILAFASCEKTEVADPNQNANTPSVNCHCGKIVDSNWNNSPTWVADASGYVIKVETNCNGDNFYRVVGRQSLGEICEWNLQLFNGGSPNF